MQKINLLYVITKLELGGAQKHLLSLLEHLDRKKFNVFLFTACESLLLEEALAIRDLTVIKSRYLERPINPFQDILALIEIYLFIKKNNIQIVHTHSSKAGILGRIAARLAGVKSIIHTVHGWSFNDYQPYLLRKLFIWIESLAACFSSKLIVVSEYDKRKGLDNHIGQHSQYCLIRYGIDYAQFERRKSDIREELGINSGNLVVGMIACFKPQKCPQDFIKTAYLINQVLPLTRFILVGDGVLRPQLEKLIGEFNLKEKVFLTGWRRDIAQVLSAMDIFVLTSLWEGLPIVVLEAMLSSLPVVVTNTGGVAEAVKEGESGFLVSPKDICSAAAKTITLLKDGHMRKYIGNSARESLGQAFSLEEMLVKIQEAYRCP